MSMRRGMGGGGGGGWGLMRSFRRDESVTSQKLSAGIFRRIARFAAPYRRMLSVFLALIILDALLGAASPLLYRAIIDDGILPHNSGLVVELALVLGALAVADAALSLWERWISARVGEGLIFDMRTQVFAHFQRMPIAFFTRTQTGALVSRLNNDVLDAQQAFTDTFSSVVGNVITVAITLAAMLLLSWQITLVALALLPIILLPARWVGRRIQALTRESYNLNAKMTSMMTERFNVAGALLVKLFGEPMREIRSFEDRAGRVRDIGVTQAMYTRVFMAAILLTASLATALVYGWGGVLAASGALQVGTVVALTAYLNRLYGPLTALSNVQVDIMTALVSFDRVFEVLDLEPMIAEKPDAVAIPNGPATIEFDHVNFSYPRAEEVSLASLESVAVLDQAPSQQVLFDVSFTAMPGQLVALVGPSGGGKTTMSHLIPRLYDVRSGAIRINGVDLRDATLDSIRREVGVVTQDAHLFHDTIRANLRYAKPDASDRGARRGAAGRPDHAADRIAAGRPRHRGGRSRLPAVRRREAAHRDRPAAAESTGHRGPRRGDGPPRLRVGARGPARAPDGARRPHLRRYRTPPLHRARGRPDPRRRRGPHRRARHPQRPARRRRRLRGAVPNAVLAPGSDGTGHPGRVAGGRLNGLAFAPSPAARGGRTTPARTG